MPRKGYTQTPEHRARISAAMKGKPKSEEHKRAIGDAVGKRATRKYFFKKLLTDPDIFLRVGTARFRFSLNELPPDES
jgi:NUMOD3 motif